MSLTRFVNVSTVNNLLKKGIINKEGVRLLDCSYNVSQKLDWKQFEKELYGKFEVLNSLKTPSKKLYLSGHIPNAVHMSLDAAMYPSKYERFSIYPPEVFQEYMQLLGINRDEHLILYGRGALGGMMFPARLAWLLKSYGHEKISLIDGGFGQWQNNGFEVATDDVKLKAGDWEAKDKIKEHVIKFEELEEKDGNEKAFIEKTDENNFLDSRGRAQFEGLEDTGLDNYKVSGSHIPGFKNTPSVELLTKDGLMKSDSEIKKWGLSNGLIEGQPVIINCNTGMQASLLSYAIEDTFSGPKPRVYNGSLKEMEARDPKKISAGRVHLP
ncbi:unnamed protein product [Auanema sp. JU1783]|nr:unnamed protein product [Auanema sp. JU1783]